MRNLPYSRDAAVKYARRWALKRNPAYYDFDPVGGDCTNFASQCIFAGAGVMNYTKDTGWYYRTSYDRSAAWTGVEYLYRFLISNAGVGPYAEETALNALEPGDIIQLGTAEGKFYHSPVVISTFPGIRLAAHTYDALDIPLSSYSFDRIRCLHIKGVRAY